MQAKLKCPECRARLTAETPCCPSGHRYDFDGGVLVLMSEQRRTQMDEFLSDFKDFRSHRGERITDPSIYDQLPFSPELRRDPVWRLRCQDARLVDSLLRRRGGSRVLDIGAWNCWLSHRLATAGHQVVAVDDFNDGDDGLGALRHYSTRDWTTIRMGIDQVDLIDEEFDLIVVNRCFSMLSEPFHTLETLKEMLEPDGQLLLTGISFFKDSTAIRDHFVALRRDFLAKYGREIAFKQFKGYVDSEDIEQLRRHGVRIRHYWRQLPGTARAMVDQSRPRYCYGLYRPRS